MAPDLKIFLSLILEGSLSLYLMFCNRYLHPLDANISHVEHDFPQLESTQEADSIDVKNKLFENKLVWNKRNIPLTAFP